MEITSPILSTYRAAVSTGPPFPSLQIQQRTYKPTLRRVQSTVLLAQNEEEEETFLVLAPVAVGLCPTDLEVHRDPKRYGVSSPVILGHECVARVLEVRSGVKTKEKNTTERFHIGDIVVLSYPSCGKCAVCEVAPAYCASFPSLALSDPEAFMGQSAFSEQLCVPSRLCVVVERHQLQPASILAPLSCSFLTAIGCVWSTPSSPRRNALLNLEPNDCFAVIGCGTIGLTALLLAKYWIGLRDTSVCVAIDCDASVLQNVRDSWMNYDCKNATSLRLETFVCSDLKAYLKQLRALFMKYRINKCLDTTGDPHWIKAAIEWVVPGGHVVSCGVPKRGTDSMLSLPVSAMLLQGKKFSGTLEGDIVPSDAIRSILSGWTSAEGTLKYKMPRALSKHVATHGVLLWENIVSEFAAQRRTISRHGVPKLVFEQPDRFLIYRFQTLKQMSLAFEQGKGSAEAGNYEQFQTEVALLFSMAWPLHHVVPELLADWFGDSLSPHHSSHRMLRRIGWVGKNFISPEEVCPLMVREGTTKRRVISNFMGKATLAVQPLPVPLVPEKCVQYTAAMKYASHPIIDFFKKISDDVIMGVMTGKGVPHGFYFFLERIVPDNSQADSEVKKSKL